MGLLLALGTVAGLASCDWIASLFPASFGDEYKDATANFIAAHDLAAPPAASDTGSTVSLDTAAIWDWAWRGQTGTGNTYEYMTLTPDGTVDAAYSSGGYALAADEPVWRLGLVNLAANPAFAAGTQAEWTAQGGASISVSNVSAISGNSMFVTITDSASDYIELTPADFYGDPSPAGNTYKLSLNVSNASILRYVSTDKAYDYAYAQNPQWDADGRYSFGLPFSGIFLTTAAGGSFVVDDLHAVRSDIPTDLALRLRLEADDASPALVPGLYEFAVWVKKPDGCYYPTESGRSDSEDYAASSVTLKIRLGNGDSTLGTATFAMPELGAGWHRLSVAMDTALNFDEGTATGAILELSVIPTDSTLSSAGEVLIAAPSLHYFIDGYGD